jgi:hypothetical protein
LSTACCQRLRYIYFQMQSNNHNPVVRPSNLADASAPNWISACSLGPTNWWPCHGLTMFGNEQLLSPYYRLK